MSSLKGNSSPRVGIIGRPNVGKSTLFNILTRSRKAVVKDEPGVTRDFLVETTEWWGTPFDVVDTGGITESKDNFSAMIREQVLSVLGSLDLLLLVMDGRAGLVPEDRDIVRIAVESGKPFVIIVNKVDRMHERDLIESEFYEFGREVISTSFEKRDGVDQVVEWIRQNLPKTEVVAREGVRIAIVGKPNVGKSSIANYLLGERRLLVSDIAGTTVDAVEVEFTRNGREYILVDTAGLRKSARRKDGVEILSSFKSNEAIRRADIVLLVVDAVLGPTVQDAKIVEEILEQHRAVIVVANKSDAAKEARAAHRQWFRDQVDREFHFFTDIPVVFTSALRGVGFDELFETVNQVWDKLHIRIGTSQLNKFFYEAIRQAPAPVYNTKNVRFYYLTQTQQVPPSFIAFANHPDGVTPAYRRFLSKRIQDNWDLKGIPVRMFVMRSGGG